MKTKASEDCTAEEFEVVVKALQHARDIVGVRFGSRAGFTVSFDSADLKSDRDLYNLLDELLTGIQKRRL
jgi:hypothetical protein